MAKAMIKPPGPILCLGLILATYLLAGCATGPLLTDVSLSPPAISPNADGLDDVTRIKYHLNGSADLSIYFMDQEGTRHYFRDTRRRSEGDYQVGGRGPCRPKSFPWD